MTDQELNAVKGLLKQKDDAIKGLWLETQLLRGRIIDSGWMPRDELDAAIAREKELPENRDLVADHFARSEQALAEVGIEDWLQGLGQKPPPVE